MLPKLHIRFCYGVCFIIGLLAGLSITNLAWAQRTNTAFGAKKDTAKLEGFISSDTKLTSDKVYKINHNVKVGKDAVLSVDGGAKMIFAPNTSLVVEGGLNFTGSPNNFIEFSSINPNPADQGIGILIRGNEGKDIVIQYCKFTELKVPLKFDVEWFRNNVTIEKNEFSDLYTGESNILITSPFVNYDPAAGQQAIDFSFSQNSFINNWGSIFIENFEDNTLNLQFTDNLITNNVVFGIDIGIPSNTPVFGLYDDTDSKYAAQISGNSIFGNYQINSSTDTIIREISFGIQGDGEEFSIPNNFFRSKNFDHISSTFDHFYQNSELPLLKPQPFLTNPKEVAPPHIWKVLINDVEVSNYGKLPDVERRDVTFEVHFNKPVLAYDQTQLNAVAYDTVNNELVVNDILIANTKWSADKTVYSFSVNNANFMRNRLGYVVLTNFKDREGFTVPDFNIGQKSAINNYRRLNQGGLKTADIISGRGGIIDINAAGGTYLPDERSVEAIEALTDFGDLSYLGPYRSLANTWEVGIMGGLSTYFGTLTYRFVNPQEFHFAAGIFGQYNIDKWMSVRAMLWYGQISGNDFYDPDPARSNRLADFKNHIIEGSLTFHWHLMKYGSSRGEKFTPTIFGGICLFRNNPVGRIFLYKTSTGANVNANEPVYLQYDASRVNPWVTDGSSGEEVWVPLRAIGVEGQTVGGIDPEGFREGPYMEAFSDKRAPKQYRKVEIGFPFGLSLDYIIYNKWVISAEVGMRFTLSRYLDNVNGSYWDRGSSYTQIGVDNLGNPIYNAHRGESFEDINGNKILDQNGNPASNEIIRTGAHQSIIDANPVIYDNKGRELPNVLTVTDPNLVNEQNGEPLLGVDGQPVTTTHSYYTAALLANPSLVEEDTWWIDPNRPSENPQGSGRNDAFREPATAKRGGKGFDHYGFFGVKVSKIINTKSKKKKKKKERDVKIKDSDRDGLSNDQEKYMGTDPKNEDTDGDGLLDGMEVNDIGSDPLKVDTDDDGLQDAREVNETSTNPNNNDTDGDGLSDGDEVTKRKTDPLNADTDGGGVNDGQEVNDNTDPLSANDDKVDTDGDGVIDAKDDCPREAGLVQLRGCPDSDKDGIEDYLDKCPNDPGPKANGGCPEIEEVTEEQKKEVEEDIQRLFKNIEFDVNSDVIRSTSFDELNTASDILRNYPQFNVIIEGHTDNVGNPVYNKTLSQKRADAVKKFLLGKGIEEARIIAVGYGEERPIASNLTESGRQLNRRVDVRLVKVD